jgi:hypothetical protein
MSAEDTSERGDQPDEENGQSADLDNTPPPPAADAGRTLSAASQVRRISRAVRILAQLPGTFPRPHC